MQALECKLKALDQKNPTPTIFPPNAVRYCANPHGIAPQKNPQVPPKVEMGTWNSVKREKVTIPNKDYSKGHNHSSVSHTGPEREVKVVIESDEDIEGGFAFFSGEKETEAGRYSIEKAKEETARILRKARRRKRKHCNTVIKN